ncbi:hypothetical protein AVEN_14957-1 [Araneus ventricosus]|uniref:Peptidase aspartic putative domain-containing protein n=1 Tax=Araneus ventricosus TaxID=182803 RepID=A0A4Y2FC81_ARAVE|nr:hypothetical protein AVEN_14957-1 [Araneus ventricosus]
MTNFQHRTYDSATGKDGCTERDICNEIESAESYEDKFIFWKTKLERCISKADNGIDTHSVSESISNKRNFKLPKIELQKFDGSLKDWLSFWGLFKKIDEDSDIANENKYQYLIQSTFKGSRAREVVESFPPTAENYTQVIECLKARFGREDVLVEATREISKPKPDNDIPVQDQTLANSSPTPYVLLQTLTVHLRGEKGRVKIRAIIDSASQRSYILKSTAQRLNYQSLRRESRRHSLFGGMSTEICHHDVYRAFLTDVSLTYNCNFEVLGQETICATIPPVADGSWMKELSENNIH